MRFEPISSIARVSVVSVLVASPIAGCGGGDDGVVLAPSPAPVGTAEGVYGGSLTGSTSSAFEAIILEEGTFWSLYGQNLGSVFEVAGFTQGTGTSTNGSFTSSNVKDFGITPPPTASLTATYNATARTINGSLTYPATGAVQFAGGPIVGSSYSYEAAASQSTIAGVWNLTGFVLNISATGTVQLTGTGTAACSATGTIVPRASGKNVYTASLSFGSAAGCGTRAGTSLSGVALSYPITATNQRQLIIALTDAARNSGLAFFSVR